MPCPGSFPCDRAFIDSCHRWILLATASASKQRRLGWCRHQPLMVSTATLPRNPISPFCLSHDWLSIPCYFSFPHILLREQPQKSSVPRKLRSLKIRHSRTFCTNKGFMDTVMNVAGECVPRRLRWNGSRHLQYRLVSVYSRLSPLMSAFEIRHLLDQG